MYYRIEEGNYSPTLGELERSGMPIFNDWWTTYVPEHKPELIRKIMHTYYFEQIGAETPDRFVHYINAHLERIMPYYNQLYASELIKISPLVNYALETNGRSIENLLTKANTTDDKFAKAIRDFAGITDKSGLEISDTHSTSSSQKDDIGHDEYSKDGTENIKDHNVTSGTEDEKTHETKVLDGNKNTTETEGTTVTDTRNLDKTETENPNETTVKKMEWGATETGSENVTGKDVSDSSGTKEWTETKDDDATTKTTTTLKETSSSDSEKDYADTPQKQLNTSGDSTLSIRRDYLTNVTWNDESSTHDSTSNQDVKYADDETKTHNENTTDKNTTDRTSTTDTSKQKGGIDTETSTHTGTNITKTEETEYNDSVKNRNLSSGTTEKETTNTDGTRDLNSAEESSATRDKEWTEKGQSDSTMNTTATNESNVNAKSNNSSTEQTHENSDLSQSSTATQNKTTEETTDKGTTTITSGFMNVSSSALLEAFRKTFLNIDNMIIEELRDNFMLVY